MDQAGRFGVGLLAVCVSCCYQRPLLPGGLGLGEVLGQIEAAPDPDPIPSADGPDRDGHDGVTLPDPRGA